MGGALGHDPDFNSPWAENFADNLEQDHPEFFAETLDEICAEEETNGPFLGYLTEIEKADLLEFFPDLDSRIGIESPKPAISRKEKRQQASQTEPQNPEEIPDESSVEATVAGLVAKQPSRKRGAGMAEERPPSKRQRLPVPCIPKSGGKRKQLEELTPDFLKNLKREGLELRHYHEHHAEVFLHQLLLDLPFCRTKDEMSTLTDIFGHYWDLFHHDQFIAIQHRIDGLDLAAFHEDPEELLLLGTRGCSPQMCRHKKAIDFFPRKDGRRLAAPTLEDLTGAQLDDYRALPRFGEFHRSHAKYLLMNTLFLDFNRLSPPEKAVLARHCLKYWKPFHGDYLIFI